MMRFFQLSALLSLPFSLFFVSILVSGNPTSRKPSLTTHEKNINVQATYWQGSEWKADCLFDKWKSVLPYTAVAPDVYNKAQTCGACIKVNLHGKPEQPVYGIINTICADCPPKALDMEGTFYNQLMGNKPNAPGKTQVDWELVDCKVAYAAAGGGKKGKHGMEQGGGGTGGQQDLAVHIIPKDGSSANWVSLQIAGTTLPIVGVKFQLKGAWVAAERKDYNYWQLPGGGGAAQLAVQITCENGKTLTKQGVSPVYGQDTQIDTNCT